MQLSPHALPLLQTLQHPLNPTWASAAPDPQGFTATGPTKPITSVAAIKSLFILAPLIAILSQLNQSVDYHLDAATAPL